jgi:serine phosphatase RsbU (regulator of sigma subunit)
VVLNLAMVAALVVAWLNRRSPLAGGLLRRRLLAAFALALLLRVAFGVAHALPPGAASASVTFVSAALGLALFWLIARVSLVEPFHRIDRGYRLAATALGAVLLLRGSAAAGTFFLVLGLTRFPWLGSLATGESFLASLGSLAVLLALLIGGDPAGGLAGGAAAAQDSARLVRSVLIVYAFFGTSAAFKVFTRDPTLGVRSVSRRLALSHVLVVGVPLVIVLTLWVSSTYLGVNADRALMAARGLDREGQGLEASLRLALRSGGGPTAAARTVAGERRTRWPGVRTFVVRDSLVERAAGEPLPDGVEEAPLADWCRHIGERAGSHVGGSGPDTLPAHGVVELQQRRWLGAAARDSGARVWLAALVPIAEPLDSTLSPLFGGRVQMREVADRRPELDSLRRGFDSLRDSLDQYDRQGIHSDSVALARGRALASRLRTSRRNRRAPITVTAPGDTMRLDATEFGFTGLSVARGLRYDGRRWLVDDFPLTARASFVATLTGLYHHVRENFLSAIPVAALVGLALMLIPLGLTDMKMVRGMGGSITRGIRALRDGAQAFGTGRLEHRIPIDGDDDLWDTARRFNQMAEGLERARELEKERDRLEQELDLARRIQARLLPARPPRIPGLDVAGVSESAREVGGDYYDHIDLGGGRVLLVVADVSGKGVPAALLMSGFRASLMSQDTSRGEPAPMATRLNEFLVKSVEPGRFVTAFLGFLDAASGRFVYVNAGHNPTVLVRKSGAVEMLSQGGLILGIMPDSAFEAGEATLAPGDLVALYTDGVTEGANAAHEQWGEERLIAALRANASEPAATIAARIVREVRAFEGESGPADDITLLVARRV